MEWEQSDTPMKKDYQVDIEVSAFDRAGLLNEVLQVVNESKTNIAAVSGKIENDIATINMTIKITGNIVGVMGFGFGNFKLWSEESSLPPITRVEKPVVVTDIKPSEDKLTVASYNVENFSTNIENTPDDKVAKIAKSFVENMKSPDIITLVEVQDNDGPTASGNTEEELRKHIQ